MTYASSHCYHSPCNTFQRPITIVSPPPPYPHLPQLISDSGINPATLSGAIDIIVVRCVDDAGEVTLSSSPFHVRFGKLQVLRAAEKRVVIKMPNNLPAPHIVPFNMKVGESGEAFFVLETTDNVPEELLTSPVVMPTDVGSNQAFALKAG